MQTSATDLPGRRPFDFARRNYHWFFAVLAVFLVVARYMPAVCLSAITADDVQVPLLFRDVVEQGHSPHDWAWGGHSDLFPDLTIGFLVNFFVRDGLAAIQVTLSVLLVAYIAVLTVLYRKNGGRNAETFAAILLLFFVLSLINFGIHHGLDFNNSLAPGYHTGPAIAALACIGLCQRAASEGCGKSLCLLAVLCFITALSDDIFQVLFSIPALATLVVARVLYPGRLRLFLPLITGISIPSLAGHKLATRLSPFLIDPGPYTHFNRAHAVNSLRQFLAMCMPSIGGDFIVFAVLDLLFVLFVAAVLAASFFKPAEKRPPLPLFMLLLFSACVIDCNWGAALLTGDFDMLAARYIRLAVLLPVFFSLGYINHVIPWSKAAARMTVAASSLAISCCALFLIPPPSPGYLERQQLVPIVRGIMEKEHIGAGLADYWYASPITLFSHNTLPMRAAIADGSLFHWLNTTEWYAGDGGSNPAPKFGLILMAKLDPDKVRVHYGDPDRIIPTPAGNDIWLYLGDKSISYNPIFRTLSNGPLNECRTAGCLLPSLTGQREGNSRVARAGRDRPTFLVYGPYPYLAPAAGSYRITIFHTWYSAPDPGKLALYDVTYTKGSLSRTLDQSRIPFIDKSQQEFTRDIVIPDNKRGVIQVRVQYFGSGDLAIDSLRITCLGK